MDYAIILIKNAFVLYEKELIGDKSNALKGAVHKRRN